MDDVAIIGGGIGGLTLALALERAGRTCTVYEAAPEIAPLGVGINVLPHASKELAGLGLAPALSTCGVEPREAVFFNRFGQHIYTEPLGRSAGYPWPQISIHRADLHRVLLDAVVERIGSDRIVLGHRCVSIQQEGGSVTVRFVRPDTGAPLPPRTAAVAVGCDGLHSAVRRQLHPAEGDPLYTGINMWRGVAVWPPILDGAAMIRAGWFTHGKLVIYPIRENVDGAGRQLVNWVVEVETPSHSRRDWNRTGRLADFIHLFASWRFDWLDVPSFLEASDAVFEFPMVDQEPLAWWTRGRITLLGDAAHPMVARGSNGAGQAILDACALAGALASGDVASEALQHYERVRRPATSDVVRMNRANPPDAILREVCVRTGDRPFASIDDVISRAELDGMLERYRRVAKYDLASLTSRA